MRKRCNVGLAAFFSAQQDAVLFISGRQSTLTTRRGSAMCSRKRTFSVDDKDLKATAAGRPNLPINLPGPDISMHLGQAQPAVARPRLFDAFPGIAVRISARRGPQAAWASHHLPGPPAPRLGGGGFEGLIHVSFGLQAPTAKSCRAREMSGAVSTSGVAMHRDDIKPSRNA